MNIIVWGLGVSGISALRYLSEKTSHQVYVVNQGSVESWTQIDIVLEFIPRENCFSQDCIPADIEVDQIILSPGVPRYIQSLKYYHEKG